MVRNGGDPRARFTGALPLAGGLVAGAALDAAFGDPRQFHPVAGFGRFAGAIERRWYADSKAAGLRHVAVTVGLPVLGAVALERALRRRPVLRAATVAGVTWAVLGGASLRREAARMAAALDDGDLARARAQLPSLCGRDPAGLGEKGITRATIESVAENTSDAVVAPLCWGAVAGLPGLIGYRAINTLDAMIGYRSPRYARFGMVAARLDDAANMIPARLTAVLTVLAAPVVGGSARRTLDTWLRHGHRHPSPNAGRCEAAAAGALGVRLGGRNVYDGRAEFRPELGDGSCPSIADVDRATRLSAAVGAAAVAVSALAALAVPVVRAIAGAAGRGTRPAEDRSTEPPTETRGAARW